MGSQMIECMREKAEVYTGELECEKRSIQLLDEFGIPRGLLPLTHIVEIGLARSEGFIWLKQREKKDHYFQQIGRRVSFSAEITAFIEPRRMRRVTGVKARELFLWLSVSEMTVDHNWTTGNILFSSSTGISRKFPVSAFVEQQRLCDN